MSRYHFYDGDVRVAVEFSPSPYGNSSLISVRQSDTAEWDIAVYPGTARSLSRALKKAADLIDPPKPRKPKETA